MKKSMKFLGFLTFSLLIAASWFITFQKTDAFATAPGEDVLRWKQQLCPDEVSTYEVCLYSGDGNTCDEWGEKTRECE